MNGRTGGAPRLARTLSDALGSGDKVFHATPTANVAAILARGIQPRKSGAWGDLDYDSPRVYLSDDTNALYAVAGQMICDHGVSEVSILMIDPSRVPYAAVHVDPD